MEETARRQQQLYVALLSRKAVRFCYEVWGHVPTSVGIGGGVFVQ